MRDDCERKRREDREIKKEEGVETKERNEIILTMY